MPHRRHLRRAHLGTEDISVQLGYVVCQLNLFATITNAFALYAKVRTMSTAGNAWLKIRIPPPARLVEWEEQGRSKAILQCCMLPYTYCGTS